MAPPMVSQAYILLTKLLSFNIFLTENAKDKVTLKGNPYGIATTITVMPKITKSSILTKSGPVCHLSSSSVALIFTIANRISSTIMMKIAEYRPNLPICSATSSNFDWRGVGSGSYCMRRDLILPRHEDSPTTITTIFPYPVSTLVPLIRTGEGSSDLSKFPSCRSSSLFFTQF